jgi:hypothetical protein
MTSPLQSPNRPMLFGETVAVYGENHTEQEDTLCGQNAEFWYIRAGVVHVVSVVLQGAKRKSKPQFMSQGQCM